MCLSERGGFMAVTERFGVDLDSVWVLVCIFGKLSDRVLHSPDARQQDMYVRRWEAIQTRNTEQPCIM